MKRMIENSLGRIAAMLRNAFIISMAVVLLGVLGVSRILNMSRELKESRAQINSLSIADAEKDDMIARQAEQIRVLECELAQRQQELDDAGSGPHVIVRLEIRLAGCIQMNGFCFNRFVSREAFDSINIGDEVSNAPWLEGYASDGLLNIRCVVAKKIDG